MSSAESVFYIEKAKFGEWLGVLIGECGVYSAEEKGEGVRAEPDFVLKKLDSPEKFTWSPYRALEPLKKFFTPFSEQVARYFDVGRLPAPAEKTVIFGVKACDIAAHRVQDYIFLEGVEPDNFYCARRDNTVIISGDCTGFKEVCFCIAMGGAPHPESGFDLNLSPAGKEGFLVEVGSEKGRELVDKSAPLFSPAGDKLITARGESRKNVSDRLEDHLYPQNLPPAARLQDIVRSGFESGVWDKFAADCVECGACNFICDTCHCFLLVEGKSGAGWAKTRLWDSCQYKNFARVAGGANPMKMRSERLRNRFIKKFDFFVDNMKTHACCGCGRCIEACPAEIDIRQVLKELNGTRQS